MPDAPPPAWYALREPETLPSPCVLVYRDRLIRNIEKAIGIAGDPDRLRPHVKTHKSARVVAEHLERGVTRFKCATVREATTLAEAGVTDVLLAYQPVGPNIDRLLGLARSYPAVQFSCLVDCHAVVGTLDLLGERHGITLGVFVDLDVGMHRTGIAPGEEADELYARAAASRWLLTRGIHAYDGHVRESDPEARRKQADESRNPALEMKSRLESRGHEVGEVVLGGTPSFSCHAEAIPGIEPAPGAITLSPGTYVYSDWGSATQFPDLPFETAALVLGRVISVPSPGRFTLDIGAKAIGADPPLPRGTILNLPGAVAGAQNEEHWAFTVDEEKTPAVGATVYVCPKHICSTIAHYDEVIVVSDGGDISERWPVTARGRT